MFPLVTNETEQFDSCVGLAYIVTLWLIIFEVPTLFFAITLRVYTMLDNPDKPFI